MTEEQVYNDLSASKFEWDIPMSPNKADSKLKEAVSYHFDPYVAMEGSHAVCTLTEWDEFKTYDFNKVYASMVKPAFIFDGRNVLDHAALREIGFIVYAIGKPLDPFVKGG